MLALGARGHEFDSRKSPNYFLNRFSVQKNEKSLEGVVNFFNFNDFTHVVQQSVVYFTRPTAAAFWLHFHDSSIAAAASPAQPPAWCLLTLLT